MGTDGRIDRTNSASPKVRVALVGYGLGGESFHAPFIAAEPRLDLTFVVTSSPERQASVRDRYPDARVLSRFDDLLDAIDEVDVVVVSTPNATHVPLAESVLRRRRHVVVDKPMAPSAAEARDLVDLAKDMGRSVVPFQNRRWDGDFRTVRALLESGTLGRLHRFESRYERWQPEVPTDQVRSWKRDPGPASGILFDLGSHLIDQAVVVFGRPVGVYAEIAVRRPGAQVADDVFVALAYPGELSVHLWASALSADRGPRFRLLGSRGSYVKYGLDVQEAALVAGRRPDDPREDGELEWGEERPAEWGMLTTAAGHRPEPTLPGEYQMFYAGLAAAVLEGSQSPVDPSDAILTAELIDAAQLSAANHQVVRL